MKQKKKQQATPRKKTYSIREVKKYLRDVLNRKILVDKEVYAQCQIIDEEFKSETIEVDRVLYDKYIRIGFLFFDEIFDWQKFATCICLCTFYKGTKKARWNKVLIVVGRGNGKDGMIAWWSCCLTSVYHGVKGYNVDIIANNVEQSLRPIIDIDNMVNDKNKEDFYVKVGEAIKVLDMKCEITARSSDAKMQDGLRSGAVVFNEVHVYQNYSKINVMMTGLGKIDDARQLYFTTNGEVRGAVLDDMLDTAGDVLTRTVNDKRFLYLIYRLDDIKEIDDEKNWVKANPSLPFRPALLDQIRDEYNIWKRNPNTLPAFPQKRMNLPIMPTDQVVVPWEVILKTDQEYDYSRLEGCSCILGIDLSKTTDWTAINLLFYDEEEEKYPCINHFFICSECKDLSGIKAPYLEWCKEGYGQIVECKEVDPSIPIAYAFSLAEKHGYQIAHVVIDDFKKSVLKTSLAEYGFSKDAGNLTLARPSLIAPMVPVIERAFINEKLVWNNPSLKWATNNTKVIPWKPKSTGDNDMGNQLYSKINRRFRKTDPFMAFVHSMIKAEELANTYDTSADDYRGF